MKTRELKRLKIRSTEYPDKIPMVNGEVTARGDGGDGKNGI